MPRFLGPDWHSVRIPLWEEILAPLIERSRRAPVHILEIGSYEGRSAVWLAERLLSHELSTLTCITWGEPPDVTARLGANLAACAHIGPILVEEKRSRDALPSLLHVYGAGLDLAYVDGSHEAADVLFDGVLCLELLKPGGLLIFDDYLWDGGTQGLDGSLRAPKLAIDAFACVNRERIKVLHVGAQVVLEKLSCA